jgi:hypothetical protein
MIDNRVENIKNICQKVNIEPIINNNLIKDQHLDFSQTISKIKFYHNQPDEKLEYVAVDAYGLIFKGSRKTNANNEDNNNIEYAVKVIPYLKSDWLSNDINDKTRPENNEINIHQILSYFVIDRQTPHILLPMFTFTSNISTFLENSMKNIVGENNNKYVDFAQKYKDNKYHDKIRILVTEWANRGDLLEFLKKHHDNQLFTLLHWKVFLFQIVSTLAIIQSKYPSFRHNNFKVNEILVTKIQDTYSCHKYTVFMKKYEVPNIGYSCLISDFDFANINGLAENQKIESEWCKKIGLSKDQNRYYDLHYFFATLIMFCAYSHIVIPPEIREFIDRIVPEKYQKLGNQFVGIRGRLMVNDEYVLPKDILEKDILFADFREMQIFCEDIVIDSDELIIL